jgi:hypothetical protein
MLGDDALFDDDGFYRYRLWRTWDESLPRAVFCMLNPSTADAKKNDNTVASCIRLARALGYGGIVIVNLFALIATDPANLIACAMMPFGGIDHAVGPDNDAHLQALFGSATEVILAWGANAEHPYLAQRAQNVIAQIPTWVDARCFGQNSGGSPKHPLYLKGSTALVRYDPLR